MTSGVLNNEDPNILRIFVVRHGQTDHNLKKILQGHIDVDLNETGKRQAELVGNSLYSIKLEKFDTSDLVRCRKTANEVTKNFPHVDSEITSDLRERNMGIVQGMFIEDARRTYGKDFSNLGESSELLIKRVDGYLDRLIDQSIGKGFTNVGFCTHGGVKRALFKYLHLHRGYKLGKGLTLDSLRSPFNTSVSIFDIDKRTGEGIIQVFGDTSHLGAQLEVEDQELR